MTQPPAITTLAELRASGYAPRSVKEEMRANLLHRLRAGEPLLPGILGYEETVLPQIENAVLAGQDIILLGERGQAKSRIARSLVGLLDEWVPEVAGAELHDDPLQRAILLSRQLREADTERTRPWSTAADEIIVSLRAICGGLRPTVLDDLGLEAALGRLVKDLCARSDLSVVLVVDPDDGLVAGRLPRDMEVGQAKNLRAVQGNEPGGIVCGVAGGR